MTQQYEDDSVTIRQRSGKWVRSSYNSVCRSRPEIDGAAGKDKEEEEKPELTCQPLWHFWRFLHEYVYTPSTTVPQSLCTTFGIKHQEQIRRGRAFPTLSVKRLIADLQRRHCRPVSDLQNIIYTSSQYKPKGFNNYTINLTSRVIPLLSERISCPWT